MHIDPDKLYEKDPKIKREDVRILQEWLKKQPHLPKIEETQVMLFLHSCYYRIEAAKNTIDKYFTRRTLHPEIFRYPGDDAVRNSLAVGFVKILPKNTPQDFCVFFGKLLDSKVEKYNFLEQVLLTNLVSTLHYHKNGFDSGVVLVFDFKGVAFGHLARANMSVLKHALDHLQEGQPVRIKSVHLINTPSFVDKIMSLLKPLLNSNVFEKIQLHSSLDTLYKYVPKECLPEEYGGDLPTCQLLQEQNVKEILENVEFFKWHDSQTVDETKRIEKSASSFGVEGTFKKLQID